MFRSPVIASWAALLLFASCWPGTAAAAPPADDLPYAEPATAPAGFSAFCGRLPAECGLTTGATFRGAAYGTAMPALASRGAGASAFMWSAVFSPERAQQGRGFVGATRTGVPIERVTWSNDSRRLLTRINRSINDAIEPTTDGQAFGRADHWALPLTEGLAPKGNCKHFALEKRRSLLAVGVPSTALSLAVARTPWGETHAVLLVATDQGDVVLDNLSPWVTPWRETGYSWLLRQAPGAFTDWRAVPL